MERNRVTGISISLPSRLYQRQQQQEQTGICFERGEKTRSWAQRQPFSSADTFITAAHLEYFHFRHSIRCMLALIVAGSVTFPFLVVSLSLSCSLFLSVYPSLFCLPLFYPICSTLELAISILTYALNYMNTLPYTVHSHAQSRTACTLSLGALLCSLNINYISQR